MANVVKLKRGSGSDPSASDMVVGEPVIRTDTAELLFKKDNGQVANVTGGGGAPGPRGGGGPENSSCSRKNYKNRSGGPGRPAGPPAPCTPAGTHTQPVGTDVCSMRDVLRSCTPPCTDERATNFVFLRAAADRAASSPLGRGRSQLVSSRRVTDPPASSARAASRSSVRSIVPRARLQAYKLGQQVL